MFARSLVWFVVAGTRDRVRVSSTSQCLLNWKMLSTLCLIQLLLHDVCMFDIFQLFEYNKIVRLVDDPNFDYSNAK